MSNSDLSLSAPSESTASGDMLPGTGPTWQEQDPVLRAMWLDNKTPQEISDALGRSTAAIMTRAARLGLPRRSAPGRKPGQRRHDQLTDQTARTATRSVTRAAADTAVAAAQTSLRVCLMCLTKFESQGRHNRICSSCRNSSEYESASALPEIHFSTT